MTKRAGVVIALTAVACIGMGIIDAVIQPGYLIKSAVKMLLFLLLPIGYAVFDKDCRLLSFFKLHKRSMMIATALGIGVYAVILTTFWLFRNVFDFSALTSSLTASTGVTKENFLFVALYISFVNSLLEEFFFRGFTFLHLKKVSNRTLAYLVSASLFAVYHIAMMIGWFDIGVVLLALVGLFAGGIIFNAVNEKYDNIYVSWLIHIFANFSTNTIGFILFNN